MTNSLRWLLLVTCGALTSCGKVPIGDARETLKGLEAVASVEDRPLQSLLLLKSCSEVTSCAGGCERNMAAASDSGWDDAERGVVLSDCFADLREAHRREPKLSALDWFRNAYFPAYLDRAAPTLTPEEQERFKRARATLGLTSR